jgi:hypothetical protein
LRIAISGSHGSGKSTLIAAFLEKHPSYAHEPEAFETLADDIELTPSEGPTPEGLALLLEDSIETVGLHEPGAMTLFERCPVDYLAYASASARSWPSESIQSFLDAAIPRVRDAIRNLDAIAFLPGTSRGIQSRPGDNPRFRKRVDAALRRALIDDDYDLFAESPSPRVVELSAASERWLEELILLSKGAKAAL